MARTAILPSFCISLSICLCVASDGKEFEALHYVVRDPFCWVVEKKKPEPVFKKVAQKKIEKKHEMPWRVQGVSLSGEGKYALFSYNNETKVVSLHQEVCSGWRIENITPSHVNLKH